jgi:hypothetical protein
MRRGLAIALTAACGFPGGAHAQRAVQDPVAVQAVDLFQHTCLPFAGLPADLRAWAVSRNLPAVPTETAAPLMGGPGQAFRATTPIARMVLISNDSGACRIIMEHADKANVDQALLDYFDSIGSPAAKVDERISPDSQTRQTLWMVSFRKRSWLISTTSHAQAAAPGQLPMLTILTTPQQQGGPRN